MEAGSKSVEGKYMGSSQHGGVVIVDCNMKFKTLNQNLHSLLSTDLIVALELGYFKGSYVNFGLVFCCKITAFHCSKTLCSSAFNGQ